MKVFKVFKGQHAKASLSEQLEEADALPMSFPMYTVPVLDLLQMVEIQPHEKLKEEGLLTEFHNSMGQAAFVSHQWISLEHPDPEGKQMRVLQDALHNMMRESSTLYPDIIQGMYLQGSCVSTDVLRSRPLFIWYDYFCVPQGKDACATWTFANMERTNDAIESIPAYIDRCDLFFVLCPVVPSLDRSELFGPSTWASRGWCLTEKLVRLLSPNPLCVIIKSATVCQTDEAPWASSASTASPGLGSFGSSEDKKKIGKILGFVMKCLLLHCLKSNDLVKYRMYLNLHKVVFRGFSHVPSIADILPRPCPGVHNSLGTIFLHQNFFEKITEVGACGYSPICYAALDGDPHLIQSLLELRASPNSKTQTFNRWMGTGPGLTVLGLGAWFGHKEAVSVLLSARADVDCGILSPICLAASSNQIECIKLLCAAGGNPKMSTAGGTPLCWASLHGFATSVRFITELISGVDGDAGDGFSTALHFAAIHAGNAETVFALVDAKADVNEPWRPQGSLKWALRLHNLRTKLQSLWSCGRKDVSTMRVVTIEELAYHCWEAHKLLRLASLSHRNTTKHGSVLHGRGHQKHMKRMAEFHFEIFGKSLGNLWEIFEC